MNKCKQSRRLFDEAYFGELTAGDKAFLDNHLRNCAQCLAQYNQEKALLSAVSAKPLTKDVPQKEFWDDYTANLHQRMLKEGVIKGEREKGRRSSFQLIPHWFNSLTLPRWAPQLAGAVLLVVLGIVIGRQFFAPLPNEKRIASLNTTTQGPGTALLTSNQNREMLLRAGRFIDRSRVILLAIENFNPETESTQAINLAFQKEISRDLVKQADSLKRELSQSKRRQLQELISELEVILLQIANIDSGSEIETLELVKGDRYIRGMLYKIRLNDLRRSTYNFAEKHSI